MNDSNSMLRVRAKAKERLRVIAARRRWPLVEAFDAAVEQLEAFERDATAVRRPRRVKQPA